MLNLVKFVRENRFENIITIYYLFYSKDNPQICKNYPIKMIYDQNDF